MKTWMMLVVSGVSMLVVLMSVAQAQAWINHRDPAGFEVGVPAGWQVKTDLGRVNIVGPSLERISIIPIFVPKGLNQLRAKDLLLTLSKRFWSQQQWVKPDNGWTVGGNAVRSIGQQRRKLQESTVLWWVNTPRGAAGFLYRVAATPTQYVALQPVFAQVLQSFRITQAGRAPVNPATRADPLQGLNFRRWTDPNEGAYSLEVPVGWQVQGGTFRPEGGTGALAQTVITSPDGKVAVRFGDVQVPTSFVVPNATLESLGYGEGSRPSSSSMVLHYMTGSEFAAYYAQQSLGQACSNLKIAGLGNHPEYIRQLVNSGLSTFAAHTAGDARFQCSNARVGYMFSETYAVNYQGTGTSWAVAKLFGFLAVPEQNALGYAILRRGLTSTRINPAWYGGELAQQKRTAAMQQRYAEYSAKLVQQTDEERGKFLDRQAEINGDLLHSSFPSLSDLTVHFKSLTAQKILKGISINSIDTLVEVNMAAAAANEKQNNCDVAIHTDFGLL